MSEKTMDSGDILHPLIASPRQRVTMRACEARRIKFGVRDDGRLTFRFSDSLRGRVVAIHDKYTYPELPVEEPAQISLASFVTTWTDDGRYKPKLMLRCVTPSGYAFRLAVVNPKIAALRDIRQLLYMTVERVRPTLSVKLSSDLNGPDILIAEQVQLGAKPVENSALTVAASRKDEFNQALRDGTVIWSTPGPNARFGDGSCLQRARVMEPTVAYVNALDLLES